MPTESKNKQCYEIDNQAFTKGEVKPCTSIAVWACYIAHIPYYGKQEVALSITQRIARRNAIKEANDAFKNGIGITYCCDSHLHAMLERGNVTEIRVLYKKVK